LCRELDLCEENVSGQFFDSDAQGFVNTYYLFAAAKKVDRKSRWMTMPFI
jgi:hypothetical protein